MTRCYVHPIPGPRPTRPGAFPQPWVILSSEAGDWQRACHLDDAIGAMVAQSWAPDALHVVTDAMRASAGAPWDRMMVVPTGGEAGPA